MAKSVPNQSADKRNSDIIKLRKLRFRQLYGTMQTFIVFLIMFIVLSIFLPNFFTLNNILNLLKQQATLLIVASGMTVIIITGEFDISVGSVVSLTAAVAAFLINAWGSIFPAVLIALLVGPLVGIFNGIVVTKGGIPSFICTLGVLMMARSLTYVVTKGRVITDIPESFKILGQGSFYKIPYSIFIVILFYIILYILLRRTALGKKIYATGANKRVSTFSGINTDRTKIISFIIVGFSASFGGLVILSRIGGIHANTATGMEFDAIAAVVIGGASLFGGKGVIWQTIIGVFIIGMIRNFLNMSQIDIFWQDFATGAIIIMAVLLDTLRQRISITNN